jgi:hypothetical protein
VRRRSNADRARQAVAVELEATREHPEIIEVLHACVRDTQRHESLELLCDHHLAGVGAEARRGKVENRGVLELLGRREDGVAESDIDLQGSPCSSQATIEVYAYPIVFVCAADLLSPDRRRVQL